MMYLFVAIIFVSLSVIQAIDYNIDNHQICTHRPFTANFSHNCSRTRLTRDVQVLNTNQILYITIIFRQKLTVSDDSSTIQLALNVNTSLFLTKSNEYSQKVYLAFFTLNERTIYLNNKTTISLNKSTITTYVYNTSSEQFIQWKTPLPITQSYVCSLKDASFPPEDVTRAYYLYTNETNLLIDLSTPSYRISPLYNTFDVCFEAVSTLNSGGIVFIVVITVLCVITVILLLFCLRKQVKELWHLLRNCRGQKRGENPRTRVDRPDGF